MLFLNDSVVYNKKKKRSTMKIVKRQTGQCASANLTLSSCCRPFQDPTSSCRVIDNNGESCYCDSLCFERNDCCDDAPVQAPCIPCKQYPDIFYLQSHLVLSSVCIP